MNEGFQIVLTDSLSCSCSNADTIHCLHDTVFSPDIIGVAGDLKVKKFFFNITKSRRFRNVEKGSQCLIFFIYNI